MDAMDKKELTVQSDTMPNSEAAAEKDVASEKDAAPEVVLQYRGYEVDMDAVTERVKAHYYSKGYKKGSITNLQIYMKPEDFTAYYVINDGVVGKVNLFYD
ncbi:MAG: hypothetical protein J1F18_06735 [Lachnospiraceae bacterium]|nr:hypothetical protein [Lachnospiraceae bacterium]